MSMMLRESSFNMTCTSGDEDIEGGGEGLQKFLDIQKGGSLKICILQNQQEGRLLKY